MKSYQPRDIEPKWQKVWADTKLYAAQDGDTTRPKYYMLTEFPYPSGEGLHAGHTREYTLGDVMARHKRMQGHNVLYPMGWDAFGLPAENYAIKNKVHPSTAVAKNVANFKAQMTALGLGFDWDREINTTDPNYYKWTQWLFLQFLKHGLAYQDEIAINWCPKEKTGLANEEVVNGVHERCGTPVEKKLLKQWMLKITAYADRLIDGLKTVDFPPRIADQQINWIGRSEGAEIDFAVQGGQHVKRVVLLHGRNGSPDLVFFPWLKTELEKRGIEVQVPKLPDPVEPDANEQADFVEKHCTLDEHTVLLGHSAGGITALRLLERGHKVHQLVLVSTPFSGKFLDGVVRASITKECERGFDFDTIRNNSEKFLVLRDTTDHIIPPGDLDNYATQLSAKLVDAAGIQPHFYGDQEPAILDALTPTITVYTTRADTLAGATFLVLAPEHPAVAQITTPARRAAVEKYVKKAQTETELARQEEERPKTGVFTGAYTENPITHEPVPIWVADYVLAGYGTGAIMAVPAHDDRDYSFAKAHGLEVKRVVLGGDVPYSGEGKLESSGQFDGLAGSEAKHAIVEWLYEAGIGRHATKYRLRDWIFSRQHYWGEPIPVIHCPSCGAVPVPDDQLPVTLPDVQNYEPTDTGESPLAAITDWVNVKCPQCGADAKRETDTMPNWGGSSWYWLRYMDPHNAKAFADPAKLKYWGEVDLYLGGMEHTTLHLLYSRFWHQFLYDQKLVPTPEPYAARRGQGIVLATDGRKMSKSLGNVINPTDIVARYGADAFRLYIMFMAPYDETTPWSDERLNGVSRFLYRVWSLAGDLMANNESPTPESAFNTGEIATVVDRMTHKTLKKIHDDLETMRFNTIVSTLMEYVNFLNEKRQRNYLTNKDYSALAQRTVRMLILMLAPAAPHIAEELWHELGEQGSVHVAAWPAYDPALLKDDIITIMVQVGGRVRGQILAAPDTSEAELINLASVDPKVAAYLDGQTIAKTIVVPRKLVNFVVMSRR